jgi:hypothetical protein
MDEVGHQWPDVCGAEVRTALEDIGACIARDGSSFARGFRRRGFGQRSARISSGGPTEEERRSAPGTRARTNDERQRRSGWGRRWTGTGDPIEDPGIRATLEGTRGTARGGSPGSKKRSCATHRPVVAAVVRGEHGRRSDGDGRRDALARGSARDTGQASDIPGSGEYEGRSLAMPRAGYVPLQEVRLPIASSLSLP